MHGLCVTNTHVSYLIHKDPVPIFNGKTPRGSWSPNDWEKHSVDHTSGLTQVHMLGSM
jgi:hypothetical protein